MRSHEESVGVMRSHEESVGVMRSHEESVGVIVRRNIEGAGLKQLQPVPIGRLRAPIKFGKFSMLGTGVMAV